MRIVSIGDLVTDFYYKDGALLGVCGGMSSHNIIANLASMNYSTKVFGVIGNDNLGKIAVKSLKSLNVDVKDVEILEDLKTRCFHVSINTQNSKKEFISKKKCPNCNSKSWYDESKINVEKILKKIKKEDILVFDNLNLKNQTIIDNTKNIKMLDFGQYFELDNYSDEEILGKIKNKFTIVNLNERVEKYLLLRFGYDKTIDLNNLFNSKLIIVTRGNKGADFILEKQLIHKELIEVYEEVDPTGAGDAFFSKFISAYIENNNLINEELIDKTFEITTKYIEQVINNIGSRGHIQGLYEVNPINNICCCKDFKIKKKIRRCNINVNYLEKRVLNAINSNAFKKLKDIEFSNLNNVIFVGTGGSYAAANFSSMIINQMFDCYTQNMYPRDVLYKNTKKVDKAFLFSYSGTTSDIIEGVKNIDNAKKIIITKGEPLKIVSKTKINKENIVTYRTSTNKGKERGFLSFEGAVVPASLFLKLYFEKNNLEKVDNFIVDCINYWNDYFDKYFKENKIILKKILKKGNTFNIFTGDYVSSASIDLESKITESGIFNAMVHEKKNFSHGRFINYEHLSSKNNIYFKQQETSKYEELLLNYLNIDGNNMILESRFNGILCEYDLLIASQYLIYYISNFLNIDISKPSYSEDAMKIYFYKGNL